MLNGLVRNSVLAPASGVTGCQGQARWQHTKCVMLPAQAERSHVPPAPATLVYIEAKSALARSCCVEAQPRRWWRLSVGPQEVSISLTTEGPRLHESKGTLFKLLRCLQLVLPLPLNLSLTPGGCKIGFPRPCRLSSGLDLSIQPMRRGLFH